MYASQREKQSTLRSLRSQRQRTKHNESSGRRSDGKAMAIETNPTTLQDIELKRGPDKHSESSHNASCHSRHCFGRRSEGAVIVSTTANVLMRPHKPNPSTLYAPERPRTVKVEFVRNASAMAAAPSPPIALPTNHREQRTQRLLMGRLKPLDPQTL